jgi:hypothetical protein
MNLGTGIHCNCAHCGRVIDGALRWVGGVPYHHECVGPQPNDYVPAPLTIYYSPMQPQPGCYVPAPLTEADVRRIVREELAAAKSGE